MQDTMRTEIKKRIAPERIPGVYRDTGAGIYLRLMTREDTDRIVAWRNSDAVRKNFIYQALFTRQSHENWIRTHVETGDVVQMIICDLANDKPLGSVYIRDIDRHHNKAEYGIFIGEADARGRGVGTAAAKLMLRYCFEGSGGLCRRTGRRSAAMKKRDFAERACCGTMCVLRATTGTSSGWQQ